MNIVYEYLLICKIAINFKYKTKKKKKYYNL